jgi:hypothetical protein
MKPHKAAINPELKSRNVLTNSPWDFVELWLKKKKKKEALFYWNQAKEFHHASNGLPRQSAPLLHYYSFMNATKALLSARNIDFNEYHGITSTSGDNGISLVTIGVRLKNNGVLPSLSDYLGETEVQKTYSLQELLFNLPYIHRTYCLTYQSQKDMYIPIKNAHFVCDKNTNRAYFTATLSADFSNVHILNRLPSAFEVESTSNEYVIKSVESIPFSQPNRHNATDFQKLQTLHNVVRKELTYINGAETLWYLKSRVTGPLKINRFSTTLTLAAMHRLSELSRYKPLELDSFLSGQKNWLISEFIQQSPSQFIDEIASEITGHQFLVPNVRPAT